MQLHTLIDREDPKCLYCGSDCDISLCGNAPLFGNSITDEETLSCRSCLEYFTITSEAGYAGTTYISFIFSCKDILVNCLYAQDVFNLKKSLLKKKIILDVKHAGVNIPSFNIDFSNKEELYKKLKTYLIFS
jgi:hypothetical protein